MSDQPTWKNRRRYLLALTAFSIGVIVYILWKELDSPTAQTAINMAFWSLILQFGTYVGGAAWEDISLQKVGGR